MSDATPTALPAPRPDDEAHEETEIEVEVDEELAVSFQWAALCKDFLVERFGCEGQSIGTGRTPVTENRGHSVAVALDDATIAVCERLARIMRSDVEPYPCEESP